MFVGYIAHVYKSLSIKFASMYIKVVNPLKAQVTRNGFFFVFWWSKQWMCIHVCKQYKEKINAFYTIATTKTEILMRKTKQF